MALMACGGIISHGKSFNVSVPSFRAANASVGVMTPGHQVRSADKLACPTSSSMLGATINCPPAMATSSTSAADNTVPAPTSI